MIGRVAVSDREIVDAVAAVGDELHELPCRLVEALIHMLESTAA